jgi:hypothetical protein
MANRGTNNSDASGTITVGGAGQALLAFNSARRYLRIANPSTATESLWINDKGATATNAPPSFELQAGQIWEPNPPSIQAISIYGGTTGHAFEAAEG